MSAKLRLRAAPATLVSLSVILALAVTALVALSGAEAAGQGQPRCGDTITTDTTLHKDMVDCPNDGILIGADNVTLNLNGHTIDGNGTPAAGCNPVTDFCDFGVGFENHHGITVKNGSIREFVGGLGAFTSRHARLLDISASRNRVVGITLGGDARILVRNCSGDRSTFRDGAGLGFGESHHVRILNCSFRHNAHVGIVTDDSNNNLIKGNLFSGNGDEAFLMEGGEGFQITHNRVVRNGAGITLGPGSRNVITRNHVSRGRDGIRIEKGHGNLVANNVVVGARRAGIRLGILHPFLGGAHNLVRGNLVRDSRVDGFLVVKKDRHSLLRSNTAKGAGDDGFDVESGSAKLTSNRALRNHDLGIEAVPGVNDGGGNVARHNGDPRQCTNIACN
jgi:parallel beta-helix repeat protein